MIHYKAIVLGGKPSIVDTERARIAEFFKALPDNEEVTCMCFTRSEIYSPNPNDTSMKRKLVTYYEAAVVKPMSQKLGMTDSQFKLNMILHYYQGVNSIPIEDMDAVKFADFIEAVVKHCEASHGFRVQMKKESTE